MQINEHHWKNEQFKAVTGSSQPRSSLFAGFWLTLLPPLRSSRVTLRQNEIMRPTYRSPITKRYHLLLTVSSWISFTALPSHLSPDPTTTWSKGWMRPHVCSLQLNREGSGSILHRHPVSQTLVPFLFHLKFRRVDNFALFVCSNPFTNWRRALFSIHLFHIRIPHYP